MFSQTVTEIVGSRQNPLIPGFECLSSTRIPMESEVEEKKLTLVSQEGVSFEFVLPAPSLSLFLKTHDRSQQKPSQSLMSIHLVWRGSSNTVTNTPTTPTKPPWTTWRDGTPVEQISLQRQRTLWPYMHGLLDLVCTAIAHDLIKRNICTRQMRSGISSALIRNDFSPEDGARFPKHRTKVVVPYILTDVYVVAVGRPMW